MICNVDQICQMVKACETLTALDDITLVGTTLSIFYTGENGVQQVKSIDIGSLDINVGSLSYDPISGVITLIETDGTVHTVDIGPFVETVTSITDTVTGNPIANYVAEDGSITTINETITEINNTILGHNIAVYTNEAGDDVAINETVTQISGNTYTNENGTGQTIVQTNTLEVVGTDIVSTVNGVSDTLPICDILDNAPDYDLSSCLDTVPSGAPSHGIQRTDTVADTFVEVTHHDGFGGSTASTVGLGSGLQKDASNNIEVIPINIVGLEAGSVTEVVKPGDTITYRVDTANPGIQDILTTPTDTVTIPQLKRLATAESGNIYLLFDNNDFSGANYTVIATLNVNLTRAARLMMAWSTDLFNDATDAGGYGADVRFISKVDGGFYNYQSNAVHIDRTDTTSIGTTATKNELAISGTFTTELLGVGVHTIQICAKVTNTQPAPFNPAYAIGATTQVSVLQRGLEIMWY